MDINFGAKNILYKVSLSKKVKKQKRNAFEKYGEFYLYLSSKNDNCIIYKENLEGIENRKYPQFIRQYTTSKEQIESIIHIINSAYVKNPLVNGGLVRTICHNVPLGIANTRTRKNETLYIDDITIVPSDSLKYKFREKRLERTASGKINHLDNVDHLTLVMDFGITRKSLTIVEQSYSEKMYNAYNIYYREKGALKQTDVHLIEGIYISKNGQIKIHPTTIRVANLRVRQPGTLLCGDCHVEVIYAKPILP